PNSGCPAHRMLLGVKPHDPPFTVGPAAGCLPPTRTRQLTSQASERLTVTASATGRHRAPLRPSTPLTTLSSAVTQGVGSIARGGGASAMSSGRVPTMGLPAQAVSAATSHPDAAKPAVAPAAPVAGAEAALLTTLPTALAGGAALTAPATATVSFDRGVFTAAPAAAPVRRPTTSPTPPRPPPPTAAV